MIRSLGDVRYMVKLPIHFMCMNVIQFCLGNTLLKMNADGVCEAISKLHYWFIDVFFAVLH